MRSSSSIVLSAVFVAVAAYTALSHAGESRGADPGERASTPPTVAPWVARSLLVTDPQADGNAPRLPPGLVGRGFETAVSMRVCVSESGAVSGVRVMERAGTSVDARVVDAVSRWRYLPYSIDGRPSAFCYRLRYEVTT